MATKKTAPTKKSIKKKATKRKPKVNNKLDARQKRLADMHIIGKLTSGKPYSDGQAYIDAGYKPKSLESAASCACETLKIPKIAKYIDLRRQRTQKKNEGLEDMLVEELKKIAFANIGDFVRVDKNGNILIEPFDELGRDKTAVIGELHISKQQSSKHGETTVTSHVEKLKLVDKLSAIDKLMRKMGMFEKDNNPPDAIDTARKIMEVTAAMKAMG